MFKRKPRKQFHKLFGKAGLHVPTGQRVVITDYDESLDKIVAKNSIEDTFYCDRHEIHVYGLLEYADYDKHVNWSMTQIQKRLKFKQPINFMKYVIKMVVQVSKMMLKAKLENSNVTRGILFEMQAKVTIDELSESCTFNLTDDSADYVVTVVKTTRK